MYDTENKDVVFVSPNDFDGIKNNFKSIVWFWKGDSEIVQTIKLIKNEIKMKVSLSENILYLFESVILNIFGTF